jgi:hypothetical protein
MFICEIARCEGRAGPLLTFEKNDWDLPDLATQAANASCAEVAVAVTTRDTATLIA